MQLLNVGEKGKEKAAFLVREGVAVHVDGESRIDDDFLAGDGVKLARERGAGYPKEDEFDLEGERIGPAVIRPGKIICIGLNYRAHIAEVQKKNPDFEVPKEPVIFAKFVSSLCGANDDVIIPRDSKKTDWEVELAVVIGKKASYVAEDQAMEHVLGYATHNDYSERAFQLERDGQWVKGKSSKNFAPLGPYITTSDQVSDPHNLRMTLDVNGERKQNSNTGDMLFKIPFLVSYLSQFMELLPGDVISTGTPEGVGMGFDPPQYLKEGDVVELDIEKIGSQKQVARNYDSVVE